MSQHHETFKVTFQNAYVCADAETPASTACQRQIVFLSRGKTEQVLLETLDPLTTATCSQMYFLGL